MKFIASVAIIFAALLFLGVSSSNAEPECIATGADGRVLCWLTPTPPATPTPRPPTPTPVPPTPTSVPRQVISNPNGNCLDIVGQTNRVYENIDIGPCGNHGIFVWNSTGITIRNVTIRDSFDGINVLQSGSTTIDNIMVTNTTRQLVVFDKSNVARVTRVNLGIADAWTTKIGWDGLSAYLSNNIVFENNEVKGGLLDTGCAIIIDNEGSNNVVRGNIIDNFKNCGIGVTDGVGNVVENNRVTNCTPASPGASCGIYVWEPGWYTPLGTCKNTVVRSNVVVFSYPYWDGMTCTNTTSVGNTCAGACPDFKWPGWSNN